MSSALIREDIQRARTSVHAKMWFGFFSKNVASPDDLASIVVPDFDPGLAWNNVSWQGNGATSLPQKGDPCLVAFDNRNQPWIVTWTPGGSVLSPVSMAQVDAEIAALTPAIADAEIAARAPGLAPVQSVFGRAGAVVKQAGDYGVADITGAASTAYVDAAEAAALATPVLRAEAGGTLLGGAASGSYLLNMDSTPKLPGTLGNQVLSSFQYDSTLDAPPSGYKTQWKVAVDYTTNATGPGVMTMSFGPLEITGVAGGAGGFTESIAGAFSNPSVAVAFSAAAALSGASSSWVDTGSTGAITTAKVYAMAVFLNAALAANSGVRFRVRLFRRFIPV